MIQFWFLWVFITLVVVIVALTLRKEREEMPRKEILRAVETSASSMGLAEKSFLWAFSWLDTRFRIQDYWGMSRDAYYGMHRQMPMSHAEKYKLRIIWYWYPLYCLGGISFLAFVILVLTGTVLGLYYVPGGEGDDTTSFRIYHQIHTSLDYTFHGRRRIPPHVQGLLHRCLQEPKGIKLVNRSRIDVLYNFLRLLGIPPPMG